MSGTSSRGGTVHAPGRVNLIGDHTDYNDGFVLPAALDLRCTITWTPSEEGVVRIRSLDVGPDEALVELPLDGALAMESVFPSWGRLPAAVIVELRALGIELRAMDATLSSDVPVGAGLSSSAAVEVACALALLDAVGTQIEPMELARLAQRAEQRASGVPCGIMDQLVSVAGVEDHAVLVDCRSLDIRPIAIPSDVEFLVVHSGQDRTLVGSAYAERRAACEATCAQLGISHLRDATIEQVADIPMARHVVSENARVLEAAALLPTSDVAGIGALLSASHASLRDDFEVSTPELDALVEELVAAGAAGARLTGAGFGGCVVAVGARGTLDQIGERALDSYAKRTDLEPRSWPVVASAGATDRLLASAKFE